MRLLTAPAVVVLLVSLFSPVARAAQLYWTDYLNNRIQRSNLDGSNVQTVLSNLPGATALAIDNNAGKMYWSEQGASRIRRANLDGSGIETILNNAGPVYDIALDPSDNKLFFASGFSPIPEVMPAIRAATLTGGSVHDVISGNQVNPYAVALFDGQVYYPGAGGGSIRRVNYDGTGDQPFLQAAGGGTFAMLFRPLPGFSRLYWLDEDDDYIRGDDDDFDLFNLRSVNPDPLGENNPWGFATDNNRLYWSDATTNKIQSIDFLGQDYQSHISVDGSPRRIAIAVPEPAAAVLIVLPWLFTRRTLRGSN